MLPEGNRQRLFWEEVFRIWDPGCQLRTLGIPESQTLFPSENVLEFFSPTFYTQICTHGAPPLTPHSRYFANISQFQSIYRASFLQLMSIEPCQASQTNLACLHRKMFEEHGCRHTGQSGSEEVPLPASLSSSPKVQDWGKNS